MKYGAMFYFAVFMKEGSNYQIIQQLEAALKKPLPAENAQRLMAPQHDVEQRFAQGSRKTAQQGAVLILLFPDHGQLSFPLIRRAEYPGVHSGQIGLPGGKRENQDKNLIATALRETEEEIGIAAYSGKHLGNLSPLFIPVSNFIVSPVIYFIKQPIASFKPDPTEVSEVLVTNVDTLINPLACKKKMMTIRDFTFETPYFDLEGEVVWGATAMILSEFVEIFKSFDHE